MYDICCIGPITLDKIVTPGRVVEMAGGTAFYFSNACRNIDLQYVLVTTIAATEKRFADTLSASGIDVKVFPSRHTVFFENIYRGDMDHRVQKVWQQSDAFAVDQFADVDAAVYHLGPMLPGDIPAELIRHLSGRGIVSLDVQGLLREARNNDVHAIDWPMKKELLPCIDILKANEDEMFALTGERDIHKGAALLADWGVKEVIITLGSKGSLIYYDQVYYDIPAYIVGAAVDATGCGDTYMAGYLYQRVKGASPRMAGQFASAMAGLKICASGPFAGSEEDVIKLLDRTPSNSSMNAQR